MSSVIPFMRVLTYNSGSCSAIPPKKRYDPLGPLRRGKLAETRHMILPSNNITVIALKIAVEIDHPVETGIKATITPNIAVLIARIGAIFESADDIQARFLVRMRSNNSSNSF
jgi:hypothetical protein